MGFLRDDDDDGIGLLGQPDRRAVPRAQRHRQPLVLCKRKDAARCRDAVVLDDNGAVVERARYREDRLEKLRCDARIHFCPRIYIVPQPHVLLEDDERAEPLVRHT